MLRCVMLLSETETSNAGHRNAIVSEKVRLS